MTPLSDFDVIYIWGFGREGRAAFDHLKAKAPQAQLHIVDAKAPDDLPEGAQYLAEGDLVGHVEYSGGGLIVKSPGVSLYDKRLSAAMDAGAELTSQTNLWFASKPSRQTVIAITGTKGKSTTSALLHHMLIALDVKAVLAGNIGDPVIATPDDAEIVVVELSSYQIADLTHAPDWFIFLNLLNDHAPWHRGVDSYRRDKARLAMIDPNARGVMNISDDRLRSLFEHRPNTVWYNQTDGFHSSEGVVHHQSERWGAVKSLPGAHNSLNVCAALTLIDGLGLDAKEAFDSLKTFKALPHRLQVVHTLNGVDFIDDTLATTPESCLLALAAFPDRPVSLILGGEDRDQDYSTLREGLEHDDRIKAIVALPENGERVVESLKTGKHSKIIAYEENIDQAVSLAYEALPAGGIVLMSPAAPRGSTFTYFGARGEAFTQAAKKLS